MVDQEAATSGRRAVGPEGAEGIRVSGRDAEPVVWSPCYDGKDKVRARFDDCTKAIVGGLRVERQALQ